MKDFIQEHINDDVSSLLLAAKRFQGIDVPFASEQIEARRRLKDKLPEWYSDADIIMSGRVPAEQCSSEQTARFKRGIIAGRSLCDLTGGMGVDFWYMSQGMERAIYTERNAALCEAAEHNMASLASRLSQSGAPDACCGHATAATAYEFRCGDGRDLPLPDVDVIYLDPARRAVDGSRVYAIEDCEPNVIAWQDELLAHACSLVVKLSPMVDISDMLRKLKRVTDIYVIGARNECKEILVKAQGKDSESEAADSSVQMHCVDFMPHTVISFDCAFPDAAPVRISHCGVHRYLYEPDVTIMKSQAFGSLCERYGVGQLDYETHLMTADILIENFPGRRFEVLERIPNASRTLKQLRRSIPKANIATRNFILTADQLRSRTGIKDGGDVYLFGAKVRGQGDVLIKCRKA